eukprot:524362-Prymnesium_polylepis.1
MGGASAPLRGGADGVRGRGDGVWVLRGSPLLAQSQRPAPYRVAQRESPLVAGCLLIPVAGHLRVALVPDR